MHSPGLLRELAERLRPRDQMMVRGLPEQPLLLVSFHRADLEIAEQLRDVWLHTLPALEAPAVQPYRAMLAHLPGMVVVQMRRRNVCTCLGHHHPRGTESRLARRMAVDAGIDVGEIDLAWESIREWQPHPLSALAAEGPAFARLRFQTALLTVLLHELEHVAYPDRQELAVRHASDDFYSAVLSELLRGEGVLHYGMSARL